MISSLSNKLVGAIALAAALFWTLGLGLLYGLMAATDDVWRWLNGLIDIPPEFAQGLSAVGAWLAQFGNWLLLVIWALGMACLVVLAQFARRLANLIVKPEREGGLP